MSPSEGTAPNTDWILDSPIADLICRKARELSRSPGFSRSDQPDIEQEFRLLLLRKAAHYNAARGTHKAWAKRLIENKAASLARQAGAQMRTYRRNAISLNEVVADREGGATELADLLDASVASRHTRQQICDATGVAQLKLDVAEANRDLPRPLRRMAALLSHVSPYSAGEVLGISRRQTRRWLAALRELYEARGLAG